MKTVFNEKINQVMKNYTKYICAILLLLGIQVNAWGTTTTQVIFPAGTTSSYSSGDWGEHGAYIGEYPTTEMTESMCISDGVGFDVKFYYAYDGGNSDGLQLKKNSSAYVEMTISSSNGITVEVTYSAAADFDIDLTGASTVTASSGNTTATINTNNTNATLKINGTSNVVYIKYIKITRKSTGTITIGHDDCVVGANITFGATSVSKSVTPAEAESGGTFSTLRVDGVNIYDGDNDCDNWVAYSFDNASGASGTYGTDWEFSVEAASSSQAWTCIDYGVGAFSNEALTISYSFLSEPEPGTYTADLIARTWDAEWNAYDFSIPVTITVTAVCTSRSITMSNFSKDFGSADFVPTYTVSAGSGTKTWTSSNTDVATIVDGKVHIVASGNTTIGLTVATDGTYCEVAQSCTMTVNALVPTVTAFTGTSSSATSITLTNAQVSNKGGAAISAYGYIYSTTASTAETLKLGETGVNTATVASADIAASTNFASKTVSGLTTGTTYYVRAYATNSAGTGYSAVQSVKTIEYTDYKFSCADWSLTGPSGDIIFITSTASKTVRSQEAFHVSGSGLPHSTELTFTISPASVSSKFAIKKADGTVPSTDTYGIVDADVYVYYTPAADASTDGLDEFSNLTVSVEGEPRTATITSKRVIGRHLPADFVIAVKKNGKWYALPDTMTSTRNPEPIEIAVDDYDNPSVAYTASTNIFNLYGQVSETIGGQSGYLYTNGETVKFGMKNNTSYANYPLFASSTGTTTLGKGGSATSVTNNIGSQYWWTLKQFATDITNPQDAKYYLRSSNNAKALRIKDNPAQWGMYASGDSIVRLIPASRIVFAEASVVEWGQHAAIIEVDATAATGIDATSVIAHLNGENSAAIDLVQTKAGDAKNNSSKYNYTVNFGDGIDFAAAASNGAMLTLEWKNGATVKAMSNIVVPKIVASTKVIVNSTNYPTKSVWDTEVHVLPGDTLEIDASGYDKKVVTISELNIYPGATVKIVGTNDSLNVRSLVLRNGWTRVGSKRYDVARLYVGSTSYLKKANNKDGWYSDWYIDYDQYYPIAVPFPVATSSICYKNTKSEASGGVTIRYYNGALRAANEQENQDLNWTAYTWGGTMPVNLEPSKGYAITARRPSGKAFSIVRLPMTFSNEWTALGEKGSVGETHKDTVVVTAYGKDVVPAKPTYVVGWNMIANPYMALHQGELTYDDASGDVIEYANVPDINFKEYDQVPIETTKLKPSSGFLVQAPKTGAVTFGAANRKVSAPSYRQTPQSPQASKQKAYIVLSNDEANDMMGLLISDSYTAEYELNADLEKILSDGNTLRTYMRYNDMNMAYVAINSILAEEWIPVSVRFPETGEYTFSMHEASKVDELEYVYLIDYDSGDLITNLLDQSYTFYNSKGTFDYRFAINAKVGKRDVPTDIDVTDAEKNNGNAVKFLYRDKLYIMRSGRIYDATGKQVKGGAQ